MNFKSFFKNKKLLLLSAPVLVFPIVATSCGQNNTTELLEFFANLSHDTEALENAFPLNINVLFDFTKPFYARLIEYAPYRSAVTGFDNIGQLKDGVLLPYKVEDLAKIKNALISYVILKKEEINQLEKEKSLLNSVSDEAKINIISEKQKVINSDVEAIRLSLIEQIQNSIKVLIVINQDALKNIKASEFIKIHDEYTDQSVNFIDYLKTKISGIDETKPLFKHYFIRSVNIDNKSRLLNANNLFDIYPFFSVTRALKSKEDLNKDTEILRKISDNLPAERRNIDENNNLLTHPFLNATVDDEKGIFAYGDGLYMSDFQDLTVLGGTDFFIAGFKKSTIK